MARRGTGPGALLPALIITMGVGGLAARLVWDYTDLYDSLFTPPLAAPFWLLALGAMVLWLLAGIAAGAALDAPVPPSARGAMLRFYAAFLALGGLLPVCLLRWELLYISFALSALLWVVTAALVSAFAAAERSAGLLMLPHLLWSTYLAYLLLGICILN